MQNIQDQFHNKYTALFAISKTLERTSYYGIRSMIVLFMISEVMRVPEMEAINIYAWFTFSIVFSQIIGAVLGDLLIGNKKAIIIGGLIQALGSFSFCIASTNGLYIGLFLVTLGSGLYSPNMISMFGKLYLNKTKLLDAAFTIFHLAVNLGAFTGTLLVGYIADEFGWNAGFITSGILILFSLVPVLFSKDSTPKLSIYNYVTNNQKIVNVIVTIVLVGLFWSIYEISYIRLFDLQTKLSEISASGLPKSIWASLESSITLPISILAIFLWTYFYSSRFFKLILGFLLGSISFGILFLIPETPAEQHSILYLISILLLGVSEIHISPIIQSVLTKNTNPKYLAILISLAFIPSRLFSAVIGLSNGTLYENPQFALLIALASMTALTIGIFIFKKLNKNYLRHIV